MSQKSRKSKRHGMPPNNLGQHFMHNKKLIQEIVDLANLSREDTVLELGGGKGALTTVLNQKAGKVIVVEYDHQLVDTLKQKTKHHPNTKIIQNDILNISLPKESFVVVSNIPYAITTPIMKMLLNKPISGFQRGVIVMEKGAAKRFTSKWIKDPYVIVWRMWFDICYVKEISRNHFSPPPKVDSALVMIRKKEQPIVPARDYLIFWGLAEHLLKDPLLPVDLALSGIFTPPQIKLLKRRLGTKQVVTTANLTETQWGIIFETMVKYAPRFRWPRLKKKKRQLFI